MVNSTSADLLNGNAPERIRQIFWEALGLDGKPSADDSYGITDLFEDTFSEDSEISKVPHVSRAQDLRGANAKLVRITCYAYHSDSEIYGGAFRHNGRWHLGRYGLDSAEIMPMSDNDIVFEERTSLSCRVLDTSMNESLESSMDNMSISEPASVTVKLYNEKEEGLLHSCLDIIGLVEVVDADIILHSLITRHQRLASMITAESKIDAPEARAEVLQKLEGVLNGDSLAAELVLLSLCSSVAIRSPVLVGPLTINLQGIDTQMAATLSKVLSSIAAHTLAVDMSIDELNKARLYASHDGEDFSAGALQLPFDSLVILNESLLAEGKLDERGVKNIQTLTHLITNQEAIFHYPFNEFKIPMDLCCLVLSSEKSLLPSTVSVRLSKASHWSLNSSLTSHQLKQYVCKCRLTEVEITETVSLQIQDDFVGSRKAGSSMNEDDLGLTLALAKEITRSHVRRKMEWSDYTHAKGLHTRIKARQVR